MKKTSPKYDYPRVDLTIRVSSDLYDCIHDACFELGLTVQDWALAALLYVSDPSETLCPDWLKLPAVLGGHARGEAARHGKRSTKDPLRDKILDVMSGAFDERNIIDQAVAALKEFYDRPPKI